MTSNRYKITPSSPETRFFLEPVKPLHRQYEALRAYFVEGMSSVEAAERFGYSPGAFRVICHRFRSDENREERFFKDVLHGPQAAPVRDRLREKVVAMRKKNMSVYDIQRELRDAGQDVSINALSVLLREEGFAKLPRRKDEERPPVVKPEKAPTADVRLLDLSPRSFRTKFAGLFFFVPLMRRIDLGTLAGEAGLPGSKMIPGEQALRSLLALKLVSVERKSHVMQLVQDQGLAIFAGLNVVPKRAFLSTYSSRVGRRRNWKLMTLWFERARELGLRRGPSLDLDFHSVPANSEAEPLEKHYISKRSRSQKGILVFLARDAEERVLCYANGSIEKSERADEILRFIEFWKERTGRYPEELVFDSQLTTYPNLNRLERKGIRFLTLRRRSRKMLARILGLAPSAWRRVTLRSLTRKYRTPKVLEEKVTLPGYEGNVRQLTIVELGHEDPTILLTNDHKAGAASLITRYARRMLIENGIAEAIHFFHLDALSSMVDLKIDLDLQLTLMGSTLYRLLSQLLPETYRRAQAKTIFDNLLDVGGSVRIDHNRVVVSLDHRTHNPILAATGLADGTTPMPWFGDKELTIRFP
jgi:transposase